VQTRLFLAWKELKRRRGRRMRNGRWANDGAVDGTSDGAVWTPHPDDQRDCCRKEKHRRGELRQPFPRHFKNHVCSPTHVATLFDVDPAAFIAYCRQMEKP